MMRPTDRNDYFWPAWFIVALLLLLASYRFNLRSQSGYAVSLTGYILKPSIWVQKQVINLSRYFSKQRDLIIENEELRISYSRLINQIQTQRPRLLENGDSKSDLSDNYLTQTGVVVLIRGNTLLVESRQLKSASGLVVYKNWLIGSWQKIGPYQAEVDLWSLPRVPLRIKITDDEGRFITDAVLRQLDGQPAADNVLRGVNLKGGERVWLLSGRWQGLPFIGLIDKQINQDNVYQSWSVRFLWRDLIKPDDTVILVSLSALKTKEDDFNVRR